MATCPSDCKESDEGATEGGNGDEAVEFDRDEETGVMISGSESLDEVVGVVGRSVGGFGAEAEAMGLNFVRRQVHGKSDLASLCSPCRLDEGD